MDLKDTDSNRPQWKISSSEFLEGGSSCSAKLCPK